jgi:hypothetical protein
MPWWQIVAIMVAFAVVAGVCVGVLTSLAGLPGGWGTVGVGAATGVIGAALIARRNSAKGDSQ